jgi:D-serine deaminase-like pyridoxal phosphate-dependent protein
LREVDPAVVETPIGYVDLQRVRSNATRVASYAKAHGLRWRPHIKTHKCREIARLQLDAGAIGITVATLREAEVMSTLTDDLLLAYPPVGDSKLERLTQLPRELDLKVALDSMQVLERLAAAAAAADRQVGVLIERDVGLERVGVQSVEEVLDLAELAQDLDGVDFCGLLFYPGQIRMAELEQDAHVRKVAALVEEMIIKLNAAGLPPEIVSGGSTPTLWQSHKFGGITEIRSGSCIFFDQEALRVGVASHNDVAYTVLATVVSTAVHGSAVVDSGSKALAKEERSANGDFGVLFDRPEVTVAALNEEHGVLDLSRTDWKPQIGEQVRIIPNHVCVSVNLQDSLLARDGDAHVMLNLEARGRGPWTG